MEKSPAAICERETAKFDPAAALSNLAIRTSRPAALNREFAGMAPKRSWTPGQKIAILDEAFALGVRVSDAAERAINEAGEIGNPAYVLRLDPIFESENRQKLAPDGENAAM